jgi:hypothetical protein
MSDNPVVTLDAILQTLLRIEALMSGQPTPAPTPGPTPQPTPAPTPSPSPTPQPTPQPTPGGTQAMLIGGTNNHVSGTDGTVVVFPVPSHWPDGAPCLGAMVQFATEPGRNPIGVKYEVCFSKNPGDFSSYGGWPNGTTDGATMSVSWNREGPSAYAAYIPPGEQWYMNWRPVGCPPGVVAGQTFYVPRG